MHYKQLLLSTTICLSTFSPLFAQYRQEETNKGFYIKASAEYAIPIMQSNGLRSIQPDPNFIYTTFKYEKISFGEGLWPSVNIGYFFMPNIGFDVGVSMNVLNTGFKSENYDLGYKQSVVVKAERPILLTPSVSYRVPFDNISILGKTGVVIPLSTDITQTLEGNTFQETFSQTATFKNRFAIGFSCSLGAEYQLSRHLAVSLELNAVALTVYTKERTLTSSKANGVEMIGNIPEQARTTSYEYEFKPAINVQEPFPFSFSRAGIKAGLAWYF